MNERETGGESTQARLWDLTQKIASLAVAAAITILSWYIADSRDSIIRNHEDISVLENTVNSVVLGLNNATAPIHNIGFRDLLNIVYDHNQQVDGEKPRDLLQRMWRECQHIEAEGHRARDNITRIDNDLRELKQNVREVKRDIQINANQTTELGKAVINLANDKRVSDRIEDIKKMKGIFQ